MICEECAKDIEAYPCDCGYNPKSKKHKINWILQTCTTPGCGVMIRSLPGEQEAVPVCKWCLKHTAYNVRGSRTRQAEGPLLSLEEFGVDLFDAIKLQSRIRSTERTLKRQQAQELDMLTKDTEAELVKLQRQLKMILDKNTIAAPDLQRLLAME